MNRASNIKKKLLDVNSPLNLSGLATRELFGNQVIIFDNSSSNYLIVTSSKVLTQAYRVLSSANLQSLVYWRK